MYFQRNLNSLKFVYFPPMFLSTVRYKRTHNYLFGLDFPGINRMLWFGFQKRRAL